MAASTRGRTPLHRYAWVFLLAALGVELGDYFIARAVTVYVSVVLGIGCGLVIVVAIWQNERRRGAQVTLLNTGPTNRCRA